MASFWWNISSWGAWRTLPIWSVRKPSRRSLIRSATSISTSTPPSKRAEDRAHHRNAPARRLRLRHHELAERTARALIYLGEGSALRFPHKAVKNGDSFQFGHCALIFLRLPTHRGSICIAMTDLGESSQPKALFTGDTLFVVRRWPSGSFCRAHASATAAMLYHSLHDKLLKFPDETESTGTWSGSLWRPSDDSERSSTIGKERRPTMRFRQHLRGLHSSLDRRSPASPEYFGRDVEADRKGAAALDQSSRGAGARARGLPTASRRRNRAGYASRNAVCCRTRSGIDQLASLAIRVVGGPDSWSRQAHHPRRETLTIWRESQMRLARVGIENVQAYSKTAWRLDCERL